MGKKKGLKLGGFRTALTPLEKEVLSLLTEEFLTVKEISIRRSCSVHAVYKVRSRLIKHGLINSANMPLLKSDAGVKFKGGALPKPLKGKIRLHAEQFHIGIIFCDDRFRSQVLSKSGLRFSLDDNTVMCYRNSIEVYSNTSFFGSSPCEADSLAVNYWNRFFMKLESRLKVVLIKQGHLNISRVRAEFADVDNELAKSVLKENQKVRIVGDDSKTWLVIDNSFNLKECETTHPVTSKHDMQFVVQPIFNDWRNNPSLLPSHMSQAIFDTQKQLGEVATGLNILLKSLNKSSAPAPDSSPLNSSEVNYFG